MLTGVTEDDLKQRIEQTMQKFTTDTLYVIIIDGDYYAGTSVKYPDMYNITGMGAVGAEKMSYERALHLKSLYEKMFGRAVMIEPYDPICLLRSHLEKIVKLEDERKNGKDIGCTIRNTAQQALLLVKEISCKKKDEIDG